MVVKKSTRRAGQDPRTATKRIIYANDTSGTMPSNRPRKTESTTTLDDFQNQETYDLDSNLDVDIPPVKASGFAVWKWTIDHWEVPTSILGLAAIILIFATKLDAKVEVLSGDLKEVKTSVEKLMTNDTRTSTEVGHLQHAVGRLEDQRLQQRK